MARRVSDSQREAAQVALDQLMEDFRRLDHSQRTLRGMVESFQGYLPERAASSGLVPRFQVLDREAEGLIVEYLDVLDRHRLDGVLTAQQVYAAHDAYRTVGPRLAAQADAMDQVVLDYDAELTRIGQQVRRARTLREQAADLAGRVAVAATALRDSGLEVPELSGILASTRAAAVVSSGWEPTDGFVVLERAITELAGMAEAAEQLAREYPERVAKARTRRASLRTALDAAESRRERVPDDLAALRREFSLANFRDVEDAPARAAAALTDARARLHDFDRLVDAGADWALPLRLLEEARVALDVAKQGVGAPGARLAALRQVKDDPEALMRTVRFTLRDAQLLVTHNPKPGGDLVARELDTLARRLDGLRGLLQGVHPDYWAVLQEADGIRAAVGEQVERFRAL